MAEYLQVDRQQIDVVHLGIWSEGLSAAPPAPANRPPTVAHLARISPEKGLGRLTFKMKSLFNHDRFSKNSLPSANKEYVAGFAGFWIMGDEAHIINIAVRERHQRQGIGELLLISIIDMAAELKAHNITLEVRISNTTAQSLYRKYGFTQTGLRRGYYTDNREDATLMSTEDITSARFQAHLQQLKQAHSRKWGIPLYQIASR